MSKRYDRQLADLRAAIRPRQRIFVQWPEEEDGSIRFTEDGQGEVSIDTVIQAILDGVGLVQQVIYDDASAA